MTLKWCHCPQGPSAEICVTGGCRAAWWPWARRGRYLTPSLPPCALHCARKVVPHWGCPRWGLTQACECLGGFGNGPGDDRLVWMWGRGSPFWTACQTGCSRTVLGCVLFCALLHLGWGVNHCFSLCCAHRTLLHPVLEQRTPGAGTRDSGAAWGSGDMSTGLLWLALSCSKIHVRNTLGEEGNIFFRSGFFFFFSLKSKVKYPCSMPASGRSQENWFSQQQSGQGGHCKCWVLCLAALGYELGVEPHLPVWGAVGSPGPLA